MEVRENEKCCGNTSRRSSEFSQTFTSVSHAYAHHISNMLKNVYAKIGVLRRLKRLMPHNVSLSLYKAYPFPHLEYCSPLLIGINKTLNSKLESVNKYVLKTLLSLGNNLDYDTIISLSDMPSLEHRRYYSSVALLYKCMNSNGPQYIKNFFQTRYTKYNREL